MGEELDWITLGGLQRDTKTDEATISRQYGRISELENETLQSTLRAYDAKIKKDAENASKEREIQHEEGTRIAVENAVQQASRGRDGYCREGREEGTGV